MKYILILFASFNLYAQQNLSSPVTVLNTPGGPGELRIRDTTGHYNGIKAATTMSANYEEIWPAANAAGVLTNDGSGLLSWGSGGGGTCPAGATGELQFYNAGSCAGSSNLTWNNSSRQLTVTGISGTAAILVPGSSGYIESDGGVYTNANVYNGFFSNTDGIAVPAFGVFPVASGQTGGYMDYAEVVYPESGSTPCYDIYGNLATAPNGLTGATYAQYPLYSNTTPYPQYAVVYQGASAYYSRSAGNMGNTPPNATYWADMGGYDPSYGVLQDVIVWNGTSPLQGYIGGIHGTVCATPPLTNPLNGLNVSSYVFARYGFATDVASADAIQLFTGGAQAESYFAGAFYPAGTATNCCGTLSVGAHLGGYLALNPTAGVVGGGSGCTSIASCNNPLIPGEPLTEGELYEESTTNHMAIYDGSNWRELAYFGDNVTFGTVTATTFSSTQTGSGASNLAFQTSNNCFEVDGQANISIGLTCGGTILNKATTAGYGAPNNAANNVYATLGGFQSTCTTAGNTVFSTFSGTFAVTCAGNTTLNNITINGTCTGSGCGSGASQWTTSGVDIYYGSTATFDNVGDLTLQGSGGLISLNGAAGGINNIGNSAINAIRGIGGFSSYTSGGGNCSYLLQGSVSSLASCITGDTIWALGQTSNTGLLRLSNGTGSGGLDGNGALVLATANGAGIIGANDDIYAGQTTGIRSFLNILGMGTVNSSNNQSFNVLAPSGIVNVYDTLPTAAMGVPPIVYSLAFFNTSGIGNTQILINGLAPAAGFYRLSPYIVCSGGCTGTGSGEFLLSWSDGVGTYSGRLLSDAPLNSITPQGQDTYVFYSNGSAMSYAVTLQSSGPNVLVGFTLERLQ